MPMGGVTAEVYVDAVLLVNFVMDYFILWSAGKLARLHIRIMRLILGAAAGALYSLVIFLPENSFFSSVWAKIICSFIMILLAYAPLSFGRFLRSLCCLYVIAFTMGGAVIAAMNLTAGGPEYIQVYNGAAVMFGGFNYSWLLIGLGMAVMLGYGGFSVIRKNWLEQQLLYDLNIVISGRSICLKALLDTGNHLVDPLTQNPVVVVEAQALENYVPQEILEAAAKEEEGQLTALLGALEQNWSTRVRLIPFNSLGRKHGLLVGVRPDLLEITMGKKLLSCRNVLLGLVDRNFAKGSRYQALLPPQLIQENN